MGIAAFVLVWLLALLGLVRCYLGENCFTCPPDMETNWQNAVRLTLTVEERCRKGKALEIHKTALKPDAVDYLRSFIKSDEIYYPTEGNV